MSTIFSTRLIEGLQPWMTADLERTSRSVGAMGLDALLELGEEQGSEGEAGWIPAWGKLLDADLCPAKYLPYLAQYVGVELPKVASEAEMRTLIKEQPARLRGTRGSIETAIRRSLAGSSQLYNLISYYPSFEGSIAHWVPQNGTVAESTEQAKFGTHSMKAHSLETTGLNPISNTTNRPAVVAGNTYTFTAYFRAKTAGRTCKVGLNWRNASNESISEQKGTGVADVTTEWVRASFTGEAPAGATQVILKLVVESAAAGEEHYIDALQLTQTSGPVEYADGSTTGYAWLGTTNESVTGKYGASSEFEIIERRNAANAEDAYHFQIIVYNESELPSKALLEANVTAVKPAGVFWTLITGSLTYAVLEAAHATYALLEAAHTTYEDMEARPSA